MEMPGHITTNDAECYERLYREKLAKWMVEHGFATDHGDSFDDLLSELGWQVVHLWDAALNDRT